MMRIDVLDKGWVELVDWMGDDARIVAMARSTRPDAKRIKPNEELLLEVIRDRHNTPLEFGATVHLEVCAPLFVRAQLFTYRHASKITMSGRHTDRVEFYIPSEEYLVSCGVNVNAANSYRDRLMVKYNLDLKKYQWAIDMGVPREVARAELAIARYSTWNWRFNLCTWLHILEQRLHKVAQWETQEYARALWTILVEKLPVTAAIFRGINPGLEYE